MSDSNTTLTLEKDSSDSKNEGVEQLPVSLSNGSDHVEDEYPSGSKLAMIVLALILSMFLASLDMTILSTAVPKITSDFHSLDDVGWYASSFLLTCGASQSSWGKAYKYFPLKTVFLIGIGFFELGSLICGVAPNSVALIVGRAITGFGAAGTIGGCFSIIGLSVAPVKRPAFSGILGATYGTASVVGPLLGGVFTDKASWRWCFYINLPIGGVSAVMIIFFFKSPKAHVSSEVSLWEKVLQMDIPGAFLIMASVVCYILALQSGGVTEAWNSAYIIGLLVAFGLIVCLFVVVEYFQKDRALMLKRLVTDRTTIVGSLFEFFLGAAFFVLLYYLPIYFQSVQDVSAAQSGIRNLPLIIVMTFFVITAGGLVTVTGYFTPFLIAGSAIATIGCGLLYTLSTTSSTAQWVGYQIVAGIGLGLCFQVPIMSSQALASPEDLSTVTAILLFAQTLGGALLVSAANAVFVNILTSELHINAPSVDPSLVLAAGASGLRETFTAAELPLIIASYMSALKIVFIIAIATSGVAFVISLFGKWTNIKRKMAAGAA